ncbi:MAG TPA: carbon storage regulator CsrA [Spirochaetia bacterium]|nr:carbon storage regulator CsrA [Spirochaetia bacterium]
MLILARKVDESIIIGDEIVVSVVDIKGDQVKLGIQAPHDVKVYRHEVYEAIQAENLAAAKTGTQLPQIDILIGRKKRAQAPPDRKPGGPNPTDA